jgi:fatty acid amide hydrolase 2
MTRRASDLMPILRVIAGADAGDPCSAPMPLGDPASVRLEGMTVIPIESNGFNPVSNVMRREVRRAAKALEERGAIVKELRFPRMKRALEIWAAMLEAGSSVHYDEVVGGDRGIPISEYFLFALGRSRHTFAPLFISILERIVTKIPMDKQGIIEAGLALRDELEEALGENGVLLHPPYVRPAPKHHDAWRTPFAPACTAIFNVLEFPVTVVPTGFDARGLPLSVQIASRRGHDHVTIRAALALEEHFGGWVMATPQPARR